jgi:uncharacterized protein (TIGR00730 family)
MLKSITVFCGSTSTCPEKYNLLADHVGRTIARQGRRLVYGGGARGLMGIVAKGAQAEGGYVIGVNVKRFANSKYPLDVDEHIMTETMQERKVELIRLGDASIALPGGVGTLDELTEIFSLAQLGIVNKPFGILNLDGYFDGFLAQCKRANEENFLKDKDYARMLVAEDVETLLQMLDEYPQEEQGK